MSFDAEEMDINRTSKKGNDMNIFEYDGKKYENVEGICTNCDLNGFCGKIVYCKDHLIWKEIKQQPEFKGFGPEHVGEKVWDARFGNGTIEKFVSDSDNPIKVFFHDIPGNFVFFYFTDGRPSKFDVNRSLYFGHDLKVEVTGEVVPDVKKYIWIATMFYEADLRRYSIAKDFKNESDAEKWIDSCEFNVIYADIVKIETTC